MERGGVPRQVPRSRLGFTGTSSSRCEQESAAAGASLPLQSHHAAVASQRFCRLRVVAAVVLVQRRGLLLLLRLRLRMPLPGRSSSFSSSPTSASSVP